MYSIYVTDSVPYPATHFTYSTPLLVGASGFRRNGQSYSPKKTILDLRLCGQLEEMAKTNPDNITNLVFLGGTYLQMQQTNRAIQLLNEAIANPKIKLPEATAARIAREVADVITAPDLREKLAAQLMEPIPTTSAAFRARIDADLARWAPVIRAANIRIN